MGVGGWSMGISKVESWELGILHLKGVTMYRAL